MEMAQMPIQVCARKEVVLWLSEVWPPLKGLRKQNDLQNV
jgi:hypothetical protein